jgi:cytochrome c oxidase cbb3-type subunit 1
MSANVLPVDAQIEAPARAGVEARSYYNDKVVRQFAIMTVVWGIVGMAVGVLIAAQLMFPALNFDIPWLTYSRLRPLHTNAVIFAFGGSALFATSYYIVQRTCHARLFSDRLAAFTFWGWQLVIVLAAITLPLGITQSKEYAELEWPIDLLIAVVRRGVLRHHRSAQGETHLRRELVLRRLHHHHRGSAHRQ